MVVFVSLVDVNAVTNSSADSSHTKAMLSLVPRSPIKPISTVGLPVCVDANKITGSSIVVTLVSIVVV